ncbi:hypothetical protein P691DRAFT_791377 [Macrolepiota fuliginosa MF-IS2]|uniref:Uncharacterized protein n=1 Tax=Macrolepiota fuliginosa MF-IS2 TaxID=1400762 RepID=A0A9P5X0L6_9AGAR|nr:hypothetical protein P691DRAFT_791377 [Macrolepiota fuliginosa MF-IS2]
MSKHDCLPPQYYIDSKDRSLLPAYIHPNNLTIDCNLIAHGTVINTNLPSMDCSDGQFFHIHTPANLPAGDDLMHTVPAILFREYLVYNANQLSSNPNPNRKRYPFGPPPGFQEFLVWFNSQPIKFKLLEWDFITGTFFYPSSGEMVDLNDCHWNCSSLAFNPLGVGKRREKKASSSGRLTFIPASIPVRDRALPGKIETSAPNTPVGLIGHITLSSLDPLAVPPSSLTLSEVIHTINPMHPSDSIPKRYPFGPPPGFQEFSVWFNSQPIKFKLLEWDFITGTFFYPSGGEMVDLNVIDLTPYADTFPPKKNDALISLNFMDNRALPGKIETSAPNTPVGLIGHITLSSLDPLAVPPSSLTLSEVVHTINPMQLMTTATPSSTTSTGIPGPANPTPQSILDQSGDDSNTNEGELIDYDDMMDDGTSRENLQNTMGGAGGDKGRVGAK